MATSAVYDDTYRFGDVYSTVDSCDELEGRLGTLKRLGVLRDDETALLKRRVVEVREYLQSVLQGAA